MRTLAGTFMGDALATPESVNFSRTSRKKKDRRVHDRRTGDILRKAHKMENFRLTLLLFVGATLILATRSFLGAYFAPDAEPGLVIDAPPAVVVEIPGVGAWRCAPKDLANSFATEDVLKQQRSITSEVRLDMIALKTDNLLNRKATFLKKVREMPWREFERHAQFTGASPSAAQASRAELENALRVAVIR